MLMDNLLCPVQEKLEEWKKVASQLEKEHAKGCGVGLINFLCSCPKVSEPILLKQEAEFCLAIFAELILVQNRQL